jgi:uncharacterized protein
MAGVSKLVSFQNRERSSCLASRVRIAGTSSERRRGLLDVAEFVDAGLWIVPCEAIHTFGMKMAIDTVFLDRNLRVRKLKANVRPGRIAVCITAHSVLELPPGAIEHSRTAVGDQLEMREVL